MTERRKSSLVDNIIRWLIPGPIKNVTVTPVSARKVFENATSKGKITGYEAELRFRREEIYTDERIIYEEKSIMPYKYSGYILVTDASKKYGLSKETIRHLCRDRVIYCEKRGGRWVVYEETLLEFLRRMEENNSEV